MARADLLLSLVKAGSGGDQASFRKAAEALIAEERANKHTVLADRLSEQLKPNGHTRDAPSRAHIALTPSGVHDLFFELTPKRTLSELVLPELVSGAIGEVVQEHHRSQLLRSYSLEPRNRLLLAGPPGNGKTSLAEALAHALMIPLVAVRYEGLIASYLGETASRLRKLFDYVRTRSCVLFFDEFDTLGKERGDVHETGEIKRVVSSLLLQIDDLPTHVVVVTATNHPELLDRAVWRRFQLRLQLPPPSRCGAERFFAKATDQLPFSLGYAPRTLADKLKGANYSELEDFVSDVARRYVLSLPDADVKQIVAQRLKQWQVRVNPDAG